MPRARVVQALSGCVPVVWSECDTSSVDLAALGDRATHIAVVDRNGGALVGMVEVRSLAGNPNPTRTLGALAAEAGALRLRADTLLDDADRAMQQAACPVAAVVDRQGRYLGAVTAAELARARAESRKKGFRLSARLARFAMDHGGDGVFWITPAGRIEWVNHAAGRMLGYARDELVGRHVWDLDPNYPQVAWASHWNDLARHGTLTFETEHIRRDARIIRVEVTITLVREADREYNCAVVRDLTERRSLERALADNEERLRFALEATQDGVWDWNLVTGHVHYSPRWCQLLGLDPARVLPRAESFEALLHPADLDHFRRGVDEYLAGLTPLKDCELRVRHASGEYLWVRYRGKIVTRDPSGRALRMVGVITDITEHKHTQLSLLETERRFNLITDTLHAVIWMVDPRSMRVTYVSPSYERVWGRPGKDILTGELQFLETVHPDDRERVRAAQIAFAKGAYFEAEYRILRPDGSERWIWDRAIPVRGETRYIGIAHDVTDRKRAEEALALSESRLREAHTLAGLGTWEVDLHTNKVWWSPEQYHLNGVPPGTPITQDAFLAMVHPDDRTHFERVYAKLFEVGTAETDYRIIRPDAVVRHMHGIASLVRDAAGRPARIRGTNYDITDRVRFEHALMESQERLRAIFDCDPECVKLLNADCRLVDINRAGLALIEADSVDAVCGSCVLDLLLPAYREPYRDGVASLLAGAGPIERVFEIVTLRGTRRWMEERAVGLRDPHDPSRVPLVLAVSRDITDRIRIEQELRESEARLLEAERIGLMGSWELDFPSGSIRWSQTVYDIFEIDRARVVPTYEAFLQRVHPDDRELVDTAYKASVRDRTDYTTVHRLLFPDGRIKHVHERGITYYNEHGTPVRSVGTVHDVTDRVRMESLLAESERRESLATVTAGIAHEFNSMLLAASMYLNGAIHKLGADPEGLARAAALIQQVQSLSASLLEVFSEPTPRTAARLHLRTWLVETVQRLRDLLSAAVSIDVRIDDALEEVQADPLALEQVLRVLLGNAADALDSKGAVTVQASAAPGGRVELRVCDTGPGIPEADRARVFDPYFTTKKRARRSGLGLALALRLVEQMGGTLRFEPNRPRGSVFVVQLRACGDQEGSA